MENVGVTVPSLKGKGGDRGKDNSVRSRDRKIPRARVPWVVLGMVMNTDRVPCPGQAFDCLAAVFLAEAGVCVQLIPYTLNIWEKREVGLLAQTSLCGSRGLTTWLWACLCGFLSLNLWLASNR